MIGCKYDDFFFNNPLSPPKKKKVNKSSCHCLCLYVHLYTDRENESKKKVMRVQGMCLLDIVCSLFKLTKQHLSSHMKQGNPSEKLFSEQICGAPSFHSCISDVLLLGLCSLSASKLSFFPKGPQLSCPVSITTDC